MKKRFLFYYLLFILASLAIFNWYPFGLITPYRPDDLFSGPDEFLMYILSYSVWGFLLELYKYTLPIVYLSDAKGFSLRRPKGWLLAIIMPAISFLVVLFMIWPAVVHGYYPAPDVWVVSSMAFASTAFSMAELIVVYQFLVAAAAYVFQGSNVKEAFRRAVKSLSLSYVLSVLAVLLLIPVAISILDVMLETAIGDVRFIEIYLRGYTPEILKAINESLTMGREVYYAQSPTWLDLTTPLLIGVLVGRILRSVFVDRQQS